MSEVCPSAVWPGLPQGSFYTLAGSGGVGILLNSIFSPFKAGFDGEAIPVLLF